MKGEKWVGTICGAILWLPALGALLWLLLP
jgi:hypothetical protein